MTNPPITAGERERETAFDDPDSRQKARDIIGFAATHGNEEIALAALGVVANSKRQKEPIKELEVQLVKEYVPM
jgi:hypothetical protein